MAELERAWHNGKSYDLALLDHMMPGMSGELLTERIRVTPYFAETKLILATSAGTHVIRNATLGLLDGVLEKPVRQHELLNCLTKVFGLTSQAKHSQIENRMAGGSESLASPGLPLDLLLAEDNRINRMFAVKLLNKVGHRVTIAENGRQAVDAVRNNHFDAVLMDIQMPEVDGVEAAKQIRSLPPPACHVHIIALTAHAMSGAHEEYLGLGMNDYISKPIDAKLLLSKLARLRPSKRHTGITTKGIGVTSPAVREEVFGISHPSPQSLDANKLTKLESILSASDVDDLITSFLTELNDQLMRMDAYRSSDKFDKLAGEAHVLVSTAGNLGAMQLSNLARQLELASKKEDCGSVSSLMDELHRDAIEASDELRIWLRQPRSAQLASSA